LVDALECISTLGISDCRLHIHGTPAGEEVEEASEEAVEEAVVVSSKGVC
jgi:hypothetical protein